MPPSAIIFAGAANDPAHVLDAAGDRGVEDAGGDQGAAKLAACWASRTGGRRGRRHLSGRPGLQPGVTADVDGLLAALLDAAGDDVADLGRIDPGARSARVGPAGGWRVKVFVVALLRVAAADRGADRLDDHDFATTELPLPFSSCPPIPLMRAREARRCRQKLLVLTDRSVNRRASREKA